MFLKYGCSKLRAIEEYDAEILFNMINDTDIESMTVDSHFPISMISQKDYAKNYKNSESCVRLMIELDNGKTIGMIILSDINYKHGTAGLAFKRFAKKEDRMPDDMYNACVAMLNYAFNELGLNCISCRTLTYNEKSLNLQKKLGFQIEGILRERVYKNGKYQDLVSSSLLKRDFCLREEM